MTQEEVEEGELLRRELHLHVAPGDPPGRGVERQVARGEDGRALRRPPPEERPDAGEELVERERLREVVVRAGVQARDAVLHAVARREHQDRRPSVRRPQAAADLDPVDVGEHQVEQDHVVVVLDPEPRPVLAVRRDVNGEPLLLEPAPEQRGHLRAVLDHQRTHRPSMLPSDEERMRELRSGPAVAGTSGSRSRGAPRAAAPSTRVERAAVAVPGEPGSPHQHEIAGARRPAGDDVRRVARAAIAKRPDRRPGVRRRAAGTTCRPCAG